MRGFIKIFSILLLVWPRRGHGRDFNWKVADILGCSRILDSKQRGRLKVHVCTREFNKFGDINKLTWEAGMF